MSSSFELCSATFQTWEQLMRILPLDPGHVCPHQFISFQSMIPFQLRTRCLKALLSPGAFITYFRCQNTFVAASHAVLHFSSKLGALMEGQLEKCGVQAVVLDVTPIGGSYLLVFCSPDLFYPSS